MLKLETIILFMLIVKTQNANDRTSIIRLETAAGFLSFSLS